MRAIDATIVAVDFEGTGAVAGYPNEPWQIGMVRLVGGHPKPAATAFVSLLHIEERPFNRHAPGRHEELRDEMRKAPRLPDLWPSVRAWLGDGAGAFAGHNTSTEKRFLKQAFPLAAIGPWIDTLALARMAFPDLGSHRLADVIARIGRQEHLSQLCPGATYHDALYDALASAILLEYLLEQPEWRDVSLTALTKARPARYHRHRAQIRSRSSSAGKELPG